jgi:predicted DNA-binding protein YlxM (UPF0122 family)
MSNPFISDSKLNKRSKHIEYIFADGEIVPRTSSYSLANFLAEFPGKTEADFDALKALSDSDYLERDRQEYNTTRFDRNILWAERKGKCYAKSTLDVLLDRIEAREKVEKHAQRVALANLALSKLTETQRRRYLLHVVHNLSETQIAEVEGSTQQAVSQSLAWSEKKLKKFLTFAEK